MSKKEQEPVFEKIEVDATTSEPYIVDVNSKKLQQGEHHRHKAVSKKYDPVEGVGKQLSINFKDLKTDSNDVSKRQKIFKLVTTIVFVVFVVGVLFYTAYSDFFTGQPIEWNKIGNTFANNWVYFIFALLALGTCFLTKGFKLSLLCKSMTGKWHFKTCMETGVIGHYYNNVTPLAVGGQPFEIYHLSKNGVHGGVASSLPIVTFFLNQLAFVILGLISLIFLNRGVLGLPTGLETLPVATMTSLKVLAIIGLITCILMPMLVIIFSIFPRIGSWLVKIVMAIGKKLRIIKKPEQTTYKTLKNVVHNSKCIKGLAKKPFVFTLELLVSFCEQIALSSIAYFTLKFFGFPLSQNTPVTILEWAQVLQLCYIIYAAVSFVPTPGNSGAVDFSFFALFTAGLIPGLAFPAMTIWRIISFYSFIIIGFVFLTIRKRKRTHLPE